MEKIHLKTVDPISQALLRSASQKALELPWERFEKLQPQDGFLRLGLSCPYGCMHGPCRIDPFGRGPGEGVCGLGRDEMAAGMLLRLCLQGTMEAAAALQSDGGIPDIRFSSTLADLVKQVLAKSEQHALSVDDIFRSNALLHRPSCSYEVLLDQALRLSLITLGFQEQSALPEKVESIPFTCGYGTLANQAVRIGFCGKPSHTLVSGLAEETERKENESLQLVALGDWIPLKDKFMPIACTSGESELLVSSGALHLLVVGPGADPGLIRLCEKMNIDVVVDGLAVDAEDIVHRARRRLETCSQLDLFADAPVVSENKVLMSEGMTADQARHNAGRKIAIIGGSDTPQLSLGDLPVELATELSAQGLQLAGWGDAALWLTKAGMSSPEQPIPSLSLDNRQGPLLAVKALAAEEELAALQGICFTGMKGCQELATALGLAYLGCRVSVATPIPIHGSTTVMAALSDLLEQNGGQLLHFDHPAQVRELAEWFLNS